MKPVVSTGTIHGCWSPATIWISRRNRSASTFALGFGGTILTTMRRDRAASATRYTCDMPPPPSWRSMANDGPRAAWRREARLVMVASGKPAKELEVAPSAGQRVRRAFLLNVTRFLGDVRDRRNEAPEVEHAGAQLRVAGAVGYDVLEVKAPV